MTESFRLSRDHEGTKRAPLSLFSERTLLLSSLSLFSDSAISAESELRPVTKQATISTALLLTTGSCRIRVPRSRRKRRRPIR